MKLHTVNIKQLTLNTVDRIKSTDLGLYGLWDRIFRSRSFTRYLLINYFGYVLRVTFECYKRGKDLILYFINLVTIFSL